MSNHIAAKFLGLSYAKLTKEKFAEIRPQLIDALLETYPKYDEPLVQNVVPDTSCSAIRNDAGSELHMVDATGVLALKVGNAGFSISSNGYTEYEEFKAAAKRALGVVSECLKIKHFSQVSLRNINLFQEVTGEVNEFTDIKSSQMWGRQDFSTFSGTYDCAGASTRHDYLSKDRQALIQIVSGVVMPGQSYVPQEEWDIWKLRGGVPSLSKDAAVELLIDLKAKYDVAPFGGASKQNNHAEYLWDVVEGIYDNLHNIINGVYNDIAKG